MDRLQTRLNALFYFYFYFFELFLMDQGMLYIFYTKLGDKHIFDKMPCSLKSWKDMLFKVGQRMDKKVPFSLTHIGKLMFPLK